MRRLIRATICRWFGHDWATPIPVQTFHPSNVVWYRTRCDRCLLVIEGTWTTMEIEDAWPHYTKGL